MANRLFQSIIYQMQGTLGQRCVGVLDENGFVVACSEVTNIGEQYEGFADAIKESPDISSWHNLSIKRINTRERSEFFVFCEGTDELALGFCAILAISLSQLKQFYDEKYDKLGFIKNILIDNIMAGDIYLKAKSLHVPTDVKRVVYLIRVQSEDYYAHEIIKNLFPDKAKDFVVSINECDVALVKQLKTDGTEDLDKLGMQVYNTLCSEALTSVHVGVGTIANTITDVGTSYKNACVALEVGKVFDNDRPVVNYDNLGIGRLIYQLPTKLCEMFLSEIFKKNPLDVLDNETIITIQKFFENNLNVSEASRQLFVHRNTLVYRLDKIYKLTGLDLRYFDDAIVFKVAMMVNRYLNSDSVI